MGERWTCSEDEEMSGLMSLALDGLLDASDQDRLDRHLAHCATCQSEWTAMQQVSDLFKQTPPVGPRLGFATRVERQLADRSRNRRRIFGGIAVATGSLSLAMMTVASLAVIILGIVLWDRLDVLPDLKQGTTAVSQIASGVGLMGRGLRLFLSDFLLGYGLPVMLVVGGCLLVLLILWVRLFVKRPGGYHGNGYA